MDSSPEQSPLPPYLIKIDHREKELIHLLRDKPYLSTHISMESLDVGDIVFYDRESSAPFLLIERKTYSDLSASVKDGRYKEQKERILHGLKRSVRKIMLLEGSSRDFTLPIKTLHSIFVNTLIRDNMHIHCTNSIQDTILFIENIIGQLPKYYLDLIRPPEEEGRGGENVFTYKISKKENCTDSIVFRNMMAQIPGLSVSSASVFIERYKNMGDLIQSIQAMENPIKEIGDFMHGIGNKRRIGEKMAEKVMRYIGLNIPPPRPKKERKAKSNPVPKSESDM